MKSQLLAAALTLAATVTATTGASASPPPSPTSSPSGPACSAMENDFANIADQPVATAIAQVPQLSTLAEAVDQADLVENMDSAETITLFAPTNQAFEALPQERRDEIMDNDERLSEVLNYHMVQGKQSLSDLQGATLTSLQGGQLAVKGSGENLTINGAQIICANVPTSNATVHIIDKVLMP